MAEKEEQSPQTARQRIYVHITRDTLPRVTEKYPFIYLEHGRMEIDDSSIKWIDASGSVIRLPAAMISCILLGPGTSITHEAVKVAAQANVLLCWVGEDSLKFYSAGFTTTADSRNFRRQAMLATNSDSALAVAKAMFSRRFPCVDLESKTMQELMGMEGVRVRDLYEEKARQYKVGWKGRSYVPGKFELSDLTNKILTNTNQALYGILCSCLHSLGYSPLLGFVHSGSPLPFVYDLADLYKADLCIDMAFALTLSLAGEYNSLAVLEEFRKRAIEMDLLKRIVDDIEEFVGEKSARRYSK